MSKYAPLWKYISKQVGTTLLLSFQSIQDILGYPIDHSFLSHKKELLEYGWEVKKIYLKKEQIEFIHINQQ